MRWHSQKPGSSSQLCEVGGSLLLLKSLSSQSARNFLKPLALPVLAIQTLKADFQEPKCALKAAFVAEGTCFAKGKQLCIDGFAEELSGVQVLRHGFLEQTTAEGVPICFLALLSVQSHGMSDSRMLDPGAKILQLRCFWACSLFGGMCRDAFAKTSCLELMNCFLSSDLP